VSAGSDFKTDYFRSWIVWFIHCEWIWSHWLKRTPLFFLSANKWSMLWKEYWISLNLKRLAAPFHGKNPRSRSTHYWTERPAKVNTWSMKQKPKEKRTQRGRQCDKACRTARRRRPPFCGAGWRRGTRPPNHRRATAPPPSSGGSLRAAPAPPLRTSPTEETDHFSKLH